MTHRPRVLVTEPIHPSGIEMLQERCCVRMPYVEGRRAVEEDLDGAHGVIVRLFAITEALWTRCPALKVVGKHGVGLDNIDVAAATRLGRMVVFTPEANAQSVAEHTITLLMALARRTAPADALCRAGGFLDKEAMEGMELSGKVLGIIGLGNIGRRVAAIAHFGLGMRVRAFDPLLSPEQYDGPAELVIDLETLLRTADGITLHVPLVPETRHLIDRDRLALMKPRALLVNTSRGIVVDEEALAHALENGALGGAALDVYEQEPPRTDGPLFRAPNTLLTPHISSTTTEARASMARDVVQGVLDALGGTRPRWLANPEAE